MSIHPLDRKLLRDLWRMRGQALAIALVAMCGIASFITMRSSYEALSLAQTRYYERYRFADVFANVKRAPRTVLPNVEEIAGVNEVQARVVFDASVDVPGLDEPATARLVSLPPQQGAGLNRVHLRAGRIPQTGHAGETLISEAFAQANRLQPGDSIDAIINGRKERLRLVGIAISPEYVSEIKGNSFPDNRRFGILWMDHEALAAALDMEDAFNDLALTLAPGASEAWIIEQLDKLLAPYGSLGAYGRDEQISNRFLDNELAQTKVTGSVVPAIFLGVVAFLIHNVLLRITVLQRPQIALLKSFGYSNLAVGAHYLKFALFTVMGGGILGIALGAWMGEQLAELYARFYRFPALDFSLSGFAVSLALLIALLSSLAGAVLAVARVLKLPPAEAMRPESPPRFRPGLLERLGLQRFIALPLRIILRNIGRNRAKAALSVLGVALAVALVVTGRYSFDALDEIIRLQFRTAQRDDVTLSFNEARERSVIHDLANLPGVLRVEPFRFAAVKLKLGHRAKKTSIMGLGPSRQLRTILDDRERPVDLSPEGLVLTKKLADMLGATAGDALQVEFLEGKRRTVDLAVSKIIDEPIGIFSYMDMATLARLQMESETVSGAFLAVDPRHQEEFNRALKGIPAIASVSLREATLQSFLATIAENLTINTIVLIGFACVIAMGVVYNSARIALSEHALELASLRILGFTRTEVGAMLLGEQGLLTLLALPLGCAIGYGLCALLSLLLSQEMFRIPLVVSARTFLLSMGVVLAATAASGLLVWRKVQQLDLIQVLKTRE